MHEFKYDIILPHNRLYSVVKIRYSMLLSVKILYAYTHHDLPIIKVSAEMRYRKARACSAFMHKVMRLIKRRTSSF